MALINFSASSSHSHHLYTDHRSPSHILQFTLSPFSWKPKHFNNHSLNLNSLKSQPRNSLFPSQVSLQDSIHQESQNPSTTDPSKVEESKNPDRKFKKKVWVNPKNPRAPQLRLLSYDSRYASLVKIAESLNLCNPTEEDVSKVLSVIGENPIEQDAVIVLNNMINPETALLAFEFFQKNLKIKKEVILYNVTLKVLRKNKDFDKAQYLLEEMLKRGVQPDNITFSTIISCARICSLPDKAVEWFEKMTEYGCNPDDVTLSAMIDAYGRAGNIDMALTLYDRARAERWRIDLVTFSTLIRIYATSGNFDGALNVYEEMKALGVKPNLVIYNTLLDAMGRAKRPWQATNAYKEMLQNGIVPSGATYAALLRAYSRARYGRDGLKMYREMKEKGLELNLVLYNSVLALCADYGYIDEALEIFEDIKRSRNCEPDSWTFSSLITIYSCSGNVSEAENMLKQMLEAGFEPNIFVLTSLIQCYGKVNQIDDVVRTCNRVLELGISPDDRFCGCLLNTMTQTPTEELGKLIGCLERANPQLGFLVKLLVGETAAGLFRQKANELFGTISDVVKKAYCNCLIDICVNLEKLEKACELLDMGITLGIYANIQSKSSTHWSLHLKSLSLGAALTAYHVWLNDLARELENGNELPPVLGVNTGHGKHRYSDKGLADNFGSHLLGLNSPFHEAPEKAGLFLTTKDAAKSWLESRKLGMEPELITD